MIEDENSPRIPQRRSLVRCCVSIIAGSVNTESLLALAGLERYRRASRPRVGLRTWDRGVMCLIVAHAGTRGCGR